jgi:hypothetical protein
MLSYLEEKRKEMGAEALSRDGFVITHDELFRLFDEYRDEFIKNYNIRGHVYAYGETHFDITDGYPNYISCDWITGMVRISRVDSQGHHTSDIELRTQNYKDARIKVWYSECKWIDIHISPSADDYTNAICLCMPPRFKEKE